MANEIGFNSIDAFTQAFLKKEKVKFSEYLKQIRNKKNNL